MKIHPPLKSLYCKICGHLFKHSYSVKRHMRIHTKEAPYKCTECDYTCRRSEYLKAHKKKHEQSNGLSTSVPLRCKVCPFTTDNKVLFTSHLDIHTKEQPKGDECDSSATKLLLGLSYNEAKTYKCKLCDYATDKKGNFVVHFRIHTGEKPYKCTMCGFTFKQLVHLKRHVRNHNKDDLFGCSICDYRTGEGKELDSHIKTHCGFVQFFLDELQYNSSDIHSNSSDMLFVENTTPGKKCTKTKLHKCIYCDYMTNQTGNLKRHQKTHFKDVPEKPISVNAVSVKMAGNVQMYWNHPQVRSELHGRNELNRLFYLVARWSTLTYAKVFCSYIKYSDRAFLVSFFFFNGLTREQFAKCIWHVNNDRLRRMEDLWLYFEDPELGYLRWSRYWAYNMHLGHVTNLNGGYENVPARNLNIPYVRLLQGLDQDCLINAGILPLAALLRRRS
ncbi:hypothetical protein FQA39_LY18415 [Lamprigera yunnana]|nr:hypothetical protein FQA39_LY18415 [Lamprigera yunnana]